MGGRSRSRFASACSTTRADSIAALAGRPPGAGTSVLAARMAVEDFGGSVFGRPIEVIDADHQNKPDLASAIARGWFDRQGVTAIADLTNSAVSLAVQQLARERGKITLFTGPATTK